LGRNEDGARQCSSREKKKKEEEKEGSERKTNSQEKVEKFEICLTPAPINEGWKKRKTYNSRGKNEKTQPSGKLQKITKTKV